MQGTRRSRY